MIALKNKGEKERMKKKALAVAVSVLFATMLLVAPQASADVYVPPGPWYNMSEWICPYLYVFDLQTGEDIGWMYSDGPMYDPITQTEIPKVHKDRPVVQGPTVIPFSTEVMIIGYIPYVYVGLDQVPPPIILTITWNGVPYVVTLDLKQHPLPGEPPTERIVGYEHPPTMYDPIEDVYPWAYPYEPYLADEDGRPFKDTLWNVYVGDMDCGFGPVPAGYFFWYIFHPNVGDWIAFNCEGETKHPPTYDITALFEWSTVQIWFPHKCFDVRLLDVHKEVVPSEIPFTEGEPSEETLYSIEDAWIWDIDPDTNQPQGRLHARSDTDEIRRSYLKFNVGDLDPTCIRRVTLHMYCSAADPDFMPEIDVQVCSTSDDWTETGITWNNAPTVGPVIDVIPVNDAGFYYIWEGTLIDYVKAEAGGDGVFSIAVKLPNDLLKQNPADPYWHRDFDSMEEINPPYLVVESLCPGWISGAPKISNILSIKNVGKVPATCIDFWETFPVESKKAIIPEWETATVKITGGRTIGPIKMPDDFGTYWPYIMPDSYSPADYDLSTLYPGETMVIAWEASVNVEIGESHTFIVEAMVSAFEIPPWKWPRAMDALYIGDPDEPGEFLWCGEKLFYEDGWRFEYIREWYVPGPINRNPLPPQVYRWEMPLDPIPEDLTGDAVIDEADVTQVELAIIGLVPFDLKMDVNANGKVDTYDLACYEQAAAA